MPDNLSSEDSLASHAQLMVRAVWLYYQQHLTQQEIAQRLKISRVKVIRLIQQAHRQGLVEIKIHSPMTLYLGLEHDLKSAFNLSDAVVTTEADEGEPLYRVLAKAAASFLEQRIGPGMVVGFGLGRTISCLAEFYRPPKKTALTFVPLVGTIPDATGNSDSLGLIFRLAQAAGAKVQYIHAPATVRNEQTRNSLLREEPIRKVLSLIRRCDLAVFSVGAADESALLYENRIINREELRALQAAGAVGDIMGHFYDANGREIRGGIGKRMIGLALPDLRTIREPIVAAGGPKKYLAIQGALKGELMRVLITDAETARWLLSRA